MKPMRPINAQPHIVCELDGVKPRSKCARVGVVTALLLGSMFTLHAQTNEVSTNTPSTNSPTPTAATNVVSADTVAVTEPAPEKQPENKPAPATSGKMDFSSFKSVADRNIFNGNRSGQRMTATRSSTQQRSVRVESFSLVGTLLSEDKEPVAFFDGTSSEFRQALKAGGRIAGFTVKEILHAGVRLTEGTNILEVLVGTGMRRDRGDEKAKRRAKKVLKHVSILAKTIHAYRQFFSAP